MITQQDDGWSGAKMTSFFSSLLNKLLPARRATSYAEAKENQVFVYGEKTKNLLTLYRKISGGCDLLSYKQLQAALFDLGIHLLPSQAFQLLHANKCLKSEGHVTFGEFCIMVDTIQEQHKGRDLRELQRQNSSKRQIRKKTSGM
ncbi:uncharacterized protein LOC106167943 [Lingula anatina]|uniref:Uncharacterized protein LOC106167943 n=1 Tax=Lingula anatina TaxID=7574 RepID=A0A1S3IXN0_LINAN|nr:uncharacterized protein LOC106167943 [Lingula anatina]|eukprot:XP_013402304.1 uncharacterized protein LOC106167943 [Lingula anatina]